jgi:hypothetical protein
VSLAFFVVPVFVIFLLVVDRFVVLMAVDAAVRKVARSEEFVSADLA